MLDIRVCSAPPSHQAGQIFAWIELKDDRPLASKSTLRAHGGFLNVERQNKLTGGDAAYLSASSQQLFYLPVEAAKHWKGSEAVKTLAARALDTTRTRRSPSLLFVLNGPGGADSARSVTEGLELNAYSFDKYKKKKEKNPLARGIVAYLLVQPGVERRVRSEVSATRRLCRSVNAARDLINEPGSVVTPAEIERAARALARKHKLGVKVLMPTQLKREGYQGLTSVGRGGAVPPRMIVLSYRPAKARKGVHLGLLGKGLTFDTGGVSIKPSANMWEMKGDMSGAAAVLFALDEIASARLPLRVTVIVVTSQNYVDANSIVPGDIIVGRNGKSIMVDNTDAEGRLILTDGLWRAGEEKVTHLVDVATLTGAMSRALGHAMSGVFGNDGLADEIVNLSAEAGEPCMRWPLIEEYRDRLKCEVADLNNIGPGPEGGAITAALFLREFVPEKVSWAHLDIAGTFLVRNAYKYFRPGAVGVMVRTLAALGRSLSRK